MDSENMVSGVSSRSRAQLMEALYGQLAAFKHIVFACTDLLDAPDSLALLFSGQIRQKLHPFSNTVWLLKNATCMVQVARDGKPATDQHAAPPVQISEALRRLINGRNVIFKEDLCEFAALCNGFQSPVAYPIRKGSDTFGLMVLDRVDSASMDDTYRFAAQLAGLIFNMMSLYRQGEEQRDMLQEMNVLLMEQHAHMSALHHTGLKIIRSRGCRHLLQIVTRAAVRELNATRAAGFVISGDGQCLTGMAEYGGFQDIEDRTTAVGEQAVFKQSMESGRIMSFQEESGALQIGPNRLEHWFVFPLKSMKRKLGLLLVEIDNPELSDPLAILANNAGMMLENFMNLEEVKASNRQLVCKANELCRVNRKLERISITDPLTGLYNHRYFQGMLQMEFARAKRYGTDLSLVLADIDFFKAVNDQYGHAAGDRVLQAVATVMQENFRETDVVARYGGEEFAMILPHTDFQMAMATADRIRRKIWTRSVAIDKDAVRVSISLGVAVFPDPKVRSRQELFNMADQALYRAKQAGRNRVDGGCA